jgi:hypothetical protein
VHTCVYRYVHVASIESNVSEVRQETAAYHIILIKRGSSGQA